MKNYKRIANESSSAFVAQRATQPYGSDHMPFINANVPAFLAIQMDDVNVPFYHDKGVDGQFMFHLRTLIWGGVGGSEHPISVPPFCLL